MRLPLRDTCMLCAEGEVVDYGGKEVDERPRPLRTPPPPQKKRSFRFPPPPLLPSPLFSSLLFPWLDPILWLAFVTFSVTDLQVNKLGHICCPPPSLYAGRKGTDGTHRE
eukprot:Sspe_Gene.61254::Locus_33958_Transcript_1_1_Confidence_1.000_Length_636::g.61254::m.61254